MLSHESTIERIEQNVMSSMIEDEMVLLNVKRGQYYSLNAVGADIWHLLNEPRTVADIISHVTSNYDATPAQIETDVMALLQDFAEEALIAVRP